MVSLYHFVNLTNICMLYSSYINILHAVNFLSNPHHVFVEEQELLVKTNACTISNALSLSLI